MRLYYTFDSHGEHELKALKRACLNLRISYTVEERRDDGSATVRILCEPDQVELLKEEWRKLI